jgi:tetratricopeptide (TPR) repeat protein
MKLKFLASLALLTMVTSVGIPSAEAQFAMTGNRKEMIHQSLLKCYTEMGRTAEMEGEYNILLAMKPTDSVLHFNYGRILQQANKKAPALAHYKKAAQYQPGNADFQGTLGQMLMYTGDYNGAYQALGRAIQIPGGDRYKPSYENAVKYMQQVQAQRAQMQQAAPAKAAPGAKKRSSDDDDD